MSTTTLHLGLDVHKDSIAIAVAQDGPLGEVRSHGTISNGLHAALFRRLDFPFAVRCAGEVRRPVRRQV